MPLKLDGTYGVSGVVGTASSAAIYGADADSGIVFSGNQTLINSDGSTIATVGASGINVTGIVTATSSVRIGTGASIGSPATNVLTLGTNNVERIRVDSSGKIGIGTIIPDGNLDVWANDIVEGDAHGQIVIRDLAAYNANPISGIIFKGEHTPGFSAYFSSIYGGKENSSDGNYAGYLALATRTSGTTAAERFRIDSNSNFFFNQTPGRYTVDVTNGATSIANGGTVDFASASGMLVVNNWSNGNVTIYICGGGTVTTVANTGSAVGSFAYNAGIAGYRWTNNYGSTATFGFFFVRTRTTA